MLERARLLDKNSWLGKVWEGLKAEKAGKGLDGMTA